jgi:hypothetical protein
MRIQIRNDLKCWIRIRIDTSVQCGGSGMYPGSRILIFTHPGSRISDPESRIPDLGSRIQNQQRKTGVKNFFFIPFFGDINFTKLNYFIFEMLKKKNLGQFSKNYFTQKIVTKL